MPAPQRPAHPAAEPLSAVIDIGSNSVRLVVYRAGRRAPTALFNEKVMAGLGAGLAAGDRLETPAMDAAVTALARFALVARAMGVERPRTVATAATRQAANGPEFAARVKRETGLEVETLPGEAEAWGSAYGVISGIPAADGIVGDLGGGSLELIRVSAGTPHKRASVPLGSLKLVAASERGGGAVDRAIWRALEGFDWLADGRGLPFYTVGGSWRALAHLDMALSETPLPVIHHYTMGPDAPARLGQQLAHMHPKALRAVPNLAKERLPALPGAAALLATVVGRIGASSVVCSSCGLREGLLYMDLPAAERARDPLLEACALEGAHGGRFAETGPALAAWIAPLFADDPAPLARIRVAAALLSDIGWFANPDYRAGRAVDAALHGPWVGITLPERALLATALEACFGGEGGTERWRTLAFPADIARARAWGLALRLGSRLLGGAGARLDEVALVRRGGTLALETAPALTGLIAPVVRRRLRALAEALALEAA